MTEAALRARWIVCDSQDLVRWDLKSAYAAAFKRAHPSFVPLSAYLEEATVTVNPAREPEHEWPVYGVSNAKGVVLSHLQKGKDFNSSYKRIEKDWFFHNPTRANVGSLGRVPQVPNDAITSPEYQVWRIREGLSPEYMELLLGLPFFLQQVQFNRVGAVKERLFTENLMQIRVPVLDSKSQDRAVAYWRAVQAKVATLRERAKEGEAAVSRELYKALGTPPPASPEAERRWHVVDWSELDRWSVGYFERARQGLLGFVHSCYPIEPLGEHLVGTANGLSTKPVGHETGFWTLKLNALTPEGLDLSAVKPAPVDAATAARFCVRRDDLLICRSNAFEYVGKCARVLADEPTILFPDLMIRARLKPSLTPEYAREVIESPMGRSFFQANSRRAVGGMWKIGADDIRNFPIPVPPLDVQEAIVARVRAARAAAARDRNEADALLARAKAEVEAMILGTKPVLEKG